MFFKFIERERIFVFLDGLEVEYDQVWSQVLGKWLWFFVGANFCFVKIEYQGVEHSIKNKSIFPSQVKKKFFIQRNEQPV